MTTDLASLIEAADLSDMAERLMLADALEEAGRDGEAKWLRLEDVPVRFSHAGNKIEPSRGTWTYDGVEHATTAEYDITRARAYGILDTGDLAEDDTHNILADDWWVVIAEDGNEYLLSHGAAEADARNDTHTSWLGSRR